MVRLLANTKLLDHTFLVNPYISAVIHTLTKSWFDLKVTK